MFGFVMFPSIDDDDETMSQFARTKDPISDYHVVRDLRSLIVDNKAWNKYPQTLEILVEYDVMNRYRPKLNDDELAERVSKRQCKRDWLPHDTDLGYLRDRLLWSIYRPEYDKTMALLSDLD